jgi:hypothetical protein
MNFSDVSLGTDFCFVSQKKSPVQLPQIFEVLPVAKIKDMLHAANNFKNLSKANVLCK